jgi:hypothetical protein
MSIEALSWALHDADVSDATEVLVLLGIANHTNRDGTGARAGQATLARYARCSIRTVRRKLVDLEERGLIRRGDQRAVDHIPSQFRPIVWDLVLPGQSVLPDRTDCPTSADTAMSPQVGHSYVPSDGTRMSYKEPSEEPSDKPSELKDPFAEVVNLADPFDVFWLAYPRKQEKVAARKKFIQLTTGKNAVDPQDIINGASRYATDPNREPQFTKLAPTWLNRGCWEDEPLPSRNTRDRQGDILALDMAAARMADAMERDGQLEIEMGNR